MELPSPFVFLDEEELARRLNVSRRTLQRWRMTGEGPPFTRLGARIGYPLGALEKWQMRTTSAHRALSCLAVIAAIQQR